MVERIIEYSAKNRFLVFLLVLSTALAGLWALRQTPVDALPDISDTQVIVYTTWPGRSPDLVEDQITYPIVTALLSAPKVTVIRGSTGVMFDQPLLVAYENAFQNSGAPARVSVQVNPSSTGAPSFPATLENLPPGFTSVVVTSTPRAA